MATFSKKHLHTFLSGLILLLFLGLVEYFFGWGHLLSPWRGVALLTLLITVLLTFTSYAVRAWRLHDYFRETTRGRYPLTFKLMLQHNLFNNILPMRSGEISFPLLMQRYFQLPLIRTLPALLWFRILDLHSLLLLGLIGIGSHWLPTPWGQIALLLWLSIPWWLFHGQRWLYRRLPADHTNPYLTKLQQLLGSLPQKPRDFWMSWLWSLLNWLVKLGVFTWVILIFANVPIQAALTGAISGDLTSVLPIHGFAGAGTYEAGVIAGMVPFAIPMETALRGAVNLHLFLLAATLLSGAISLLIPFKASREKTEIAKNQG